MKKFRKIRYDLELKKIIKIIQQEKQKQKKKKNLLILLQFPDGLKQHATAIANSIEKKTNTRCFVWLGSCFGSCDVAKHIPKNFDFVFSFGHSLWPFAKKIKANEI